MKFIRGLHQPPNRTTKHTYTHKLTDAELITAYKRGVKRIFVHTITEIRLKSKITGIMKNIISLPQLQNNHRDI